MFKCVPELEVAFNCNLKLEVIHLTVLGVESHNWLKAPNLNLFSAF